MDAEDAEDMSNYDFVVPDVSKLNIPEDDSYLKFYYNAEKSTADYTLKVDPFKQLATISYRFLPHFKSYYYLKTKIYGWVCADQYFSPLNGLFQTDFVLFN